MILSIDESIQRLKAEILSQDWSLSQKRVKLLDTAFFSLKQRFKTRKGTHAILIMAGSALDYIKKKKENSIPDAIDFIKEAMAHVVNLYEESDFNPASEEKVFQTVYSRFTMLKTKVKEEKKRSIEPETAPVSRPLPVKAAVEETTIAQVENKTGDARLQAREMLIASLKMADAVLENKSEVEKLIHELKTSFERMDGLCKTIRQLLKELQAEIKPESVGLQDEEDDYNDNVGFSSAAKFRQLVIGETITAVSEENISLISPVARAKLENYLKTSNVP